MSLIDPGVCPLIPGSLKQIDNGLTDAVWGVNRQNNIYRLIGKSQLIQVPGTLKHVTTGPAGVWGVNKNNDIYYRNGLESNKHCVGTSWRKIDGKLKQIDSGPYGIVYGVNAHDQIFCRTGISSSTPYGTGWKQVTSHGRLKYVSCGALGCWGVSSGDRVYFRSGVSRSNCAGSRWHGISGSLKQIEAGKLGDVYGINSSGKVYQRTGISRSKPKGSDWKKIQNFASHVTTGLNGQYILVNGKIHQTQCW